MEECVSIARELGDANYTGIALYYLAYSYYAEGDHARAAALYDESLAALPANEDGLWHAVRFFQGINLWEMEGGEHGVAQVRDGLANFRKDGFEWGVIFAMGWLGDRMLEMGNLTQAQQHLHEGLRLAFRNGMWLWVARCLALLAVVAAQKGQAALAVTLWSSATAHGGIGEAQPERQSHLDAARAELDEHARVAAEAEGRTMSIEQAVHYALQM